MKIKELSFSDIQNESNNVLKFIKNKCSENNILFFLGYGTALGAVRHKGFIPWDDDIDIIMFRKDYEAFKEVMSKETGRYKLADIEVDRDYFLLMPKVYDTMTYSVWSVSNIKYSFGVWVDIFIIDGLPKERIKQLRLSRRLNKIQRWYNISIYKTKYSNNIIKNLYVFLNTWPKLFGPRFFVRKIYNILSRETIDSDFVSNMLFVPQNDRENYIFRKDIFGKGKPMPFEGVSYNVPELFDEYLTRLYGNYMEFPPLEKRVSHHSYKFYYKENDY